MQTFLSNNFRIMLKIEGSVKYSEWIPPREF